MITEDIHVFGTITSCLYPTRTHILIINLIPMIISKPNLRKIMPPIQCPIMINSPQQPIFHPILNTLIIYLQILIILHNSIDLLRAISPMFEACQMQEEIFGCGIDEDLFGEVGFSFAFLTEEIWDVLFGDLAFYELLEFDCSGGGCIAESVCLWGLWEIQGETLISLEFEFSMLALVTDKLVDHLRRKQLNNLTILNLQHLIDKILIIRLNSSNLLIIIQIQLLISFQSFTVFLIEYLQETYQKLLGILLLVTLNYLYFFL